MSQMPPGFPTPPAYAAPGYPQVRPNRSGIILALGIIGIVSCIVCGIIAWVMANNDLRDMDRGLMDSSGRGMTQAGKILGIVSVCLHAVGLLFGLVWMLFVLGILVSGAAGGAGHP